MFHKEFYPTPSEVIEKMINGHDLTNKVILEPSAGKGDILKFIAQNFHGTQRLFCEITPDLAKLSSQYGSFLKADFFDLRENDIANVDFIFMNPPFSNAAKHINHAYNIAPDGCTIVALMNESNLYTNRNYKETSELEFKINNYGFKESLGNVFSDAERETNVSVAMVTIYKPLRNEKDYFESIDFDLESEDAYEFSDGIKPFNYIESLVNRYTAAVKEYENVLHSANKMNDLIGEYANKLTFTIKQGEFETSFEKFKVDLRKRMWGKILNKLDLKKFSTRSMKRNFDKFFEQQKQVPFSVKNIQKLLMVVIGTYESRINEAIIDAFDRISDHSSDNKRTHNEVWKTNKYCEVGEKFILNYICHVGYHGKVSLNYNGQNAVIFDDLVKALCYTKGIKIGAFPTLYYVVSSNKFDFGTWYNFYGEGVALPLLQIKFFKKGTMHVRFADKDDANRLNRKVAEIRGFVLKD
jgi:hypothetical protein